MSKNQKWGRRKDTNKPYPKGGIPIDGRNYNNLPPPTRSGERIKLKSYILPVLFEKDGSTDSSIYKVSAQDEEDAKTLIQDDLKENEIDLIQFGEIQPYTKGKYFEYEIVGDTVGRVTPSRRLTKAEAEKELNHLVEEGLLRMEYKEFPGDRRPWEVNYVSRKGDYLVYRYAKGTEVGRIPSSINEGKTREQAEKKMRAVMVSAIKKHGPDKIRQELGGR